MRKLLMCLVMLGWVIPSIAGADQLRGFFPIAPQMGSISEWNPDAVTDNFRNKLSRLMLDPSSYAYFLNQNWTNSPVGTPVDYLDHVPGSQFVFIVTHANPGAFAMTYWNTPAARNAWWDNWNVEGKAVHFYREDAPPRPAISVRASGITEYLQPASNALVALLGCESAGLREAWFPGMPYGNRWTSGPAYASFEYSIFLDYAAEEAVNLAKCLICDKHPLYGADVEDAQRAGRVLHVDGNGRWRLNPEMSCWNWVGYFYDAGVADGVVYCSVLNEDPDSYYIVRGLTADGGADTLSVFPGSGTDGKWVLRTHSWSVDVKDYPLMDIIHTDQHGVRTVSEEFLTSGGHRRQDGDVHVSGLEDYESIPGPGEVVEVWDHRGVDALCADVVIYSSVFEYLSSARDHIEQYITTEGYPLKVRGFYGPANFEHQQSVMSACRAENVAYMDQAGPGDRVYPTLPGPIGVFIGTKAEVRYNLWDDDPLLNPCVQPQCRSYNDLGDVDGDGIAECPVMVIHTTGLDDLIGRLETAHEWNARNPVESSGRAIIISGDHFEPGPAQLVTRELELLQAAYVTQGTPAVLLKESDYPSWVERRAAVIDEMNQGVETLWFQGVSTRIDRFTLFLNGPDNFPREAIVTDQRYVGFGLACETNGLHWHGGPYGYGWMYEVLSAPATGSTMVGMVGQMNGDYEHRHQLVLEVAMHELDNVAEGEFLAETVWRINNVMATQFMEVNYARGNTLFANGLIVPPGRVSTATVSEVQASPERQLWSVPSGVGRDIHFNLTQQGRVNLAIYDVSGRRVTTLVDGSTLASGSHRTTWYGRNGSGERVPSGIYFARLAVDGRKVATDKFVLVR